MKTAGILSLIQIFKIFLLISTFLLVSACGGGGGSDDGDNDDAPDTSISSAPVHPSNSSSADFVFISGCAVGV